MAMAEGRGLVGSAVHDRHRSAATVKPAADCSYRRHYRWRKRRRACLGRPADQRGSVPSFGTVLAFRVSSSYSYSTLLTCSPCFMLLSHAFFARKLITCGAPATGYELDKKREIGSNQQAKCGGTGTGQFSCTGRLSAHMLYRKAPRPLI